MNVVEHDTGVRRVAIEAIAVSRSFEGVRAVEGANLVVARGSVHALVGENGAGKSTLLKVLSGVLVPDSGVVTVDGERVRPGEPLAMRSRGVQAVGQEFTLLPWMTVAENLLLGVEPRGRSRLVRRRDLPVNAEEILALYGVSHLDPRAVVAQLSIAQQQVLEIVTALSHEPKILLLDEPTSALGEPDVEWLFDRVRVIRASGGSVIFTSHRWKEIVGLATVVTIMRNGKTVATAPHFDQDEAVTIMTGRSLGAIYPARAPAPVTVGAPALSVRGLSGSWIANVTFEVRPGEILGIGGLAGQGQRELFLTLFGAEKARRGEVLVKGKRLRLRSPRDAIRSGIGIALVPEDRKREGLFLPMSVRDNLTMCVLDRLAFAGVLRRRNERSLVAHMVEQLQVVTRNPVYQKVETLSGGNQQKVLIGRWLLADTKILLLFDITRGVDVGTKRDIYELMVREAEAGVSIVVYSTETDELAHLCHRVLVMRAGQIVEELSGARLDAEQIVNASLHSGPSIAAAAS